MMVLTLSWRRRHANRLCGGVVASDRTALSHNNGMSNKLAGDQSFVDWRRNGFDPKSVPTDVIERNMVGAWMRCAIDSDPMRGVRAIMYFLDHDDCLAIARDYVTEEWVTGLLNNMRYAPDLLDLFVLLAECSFCRDLLWDNLIDRIPEGPHSQAFARVLNDRVPQDLDSRVAQALGNLGYPEIVGNEPLLHHWTVVQGYLQLLSDDEFKQLRDNIGLHCRRDMLARWLSYDAPVTYGPLPDPPARFYSAASFWRWTYESLVFKGSSIAVHWKSLESRSTDLFDWWTTMHHFKGASSRSSCQNATKKDTRVLELEDREVPHFEVRFHQELVDPYKLLLQLKAEAASQHPIYGQSASAARVALRSDSEKCAILARLEAIDCLSAKEIVRYFYLYGADRSTLNTRTAIKLASSSDGDPNYDLVIFSLNASFELVASLLVRNFAPSCKLTAVRMENGRLGLLKSPSA